MKDKTLHMIGNAHIDPVWLWQWPEGFHAVQATFRSALDRMEEYPEFVFISSSAAFYEWIEKSDPKMFAEIHQRVAEGRWGLVGGWWIQPDCNLPSGESFVRQALYGQRYFKEKFGVTARVGYNVDSFGHHGMLPQLLKKSGLDYYVFLRPMPNEKALPARLFWWEADDSSRVLAFRIPYEYCAWGQGLEDHVRRCAGELKSPNRRSMCFYGVGNHGGGPTRENLDSLQRMADDPSFPQLTLGTPDEFFESALADGLSIPTVHDDLQHHSVGCYSAHSSVKRWNRQAENLLVTAEKFSALAAWTTGQPYPEDFERAWKAVLFNQFHDVLAGTSLPAAYEDARDLYGEARAIATRGLTTALQSLAWQVGSEPQEGMTPLVVFNPHAWPVRAHVEVELGRWRTGDGLVDDAGCPVPFQHIRPQAAANGRCRIAFVASLPPLGYRTYRVLPGLPPLEIEPMPAGEDWLENERFRLEIDLSTGMIRRLFDKTVQVEVFCGPAARPVARDDPSDTWSHNVFVYNGTLNDFQVESVRLVEVGPVRSTLRVVSCYGTSRMVQEFSLYRELEPVEVRVRVDWRERQKILKLRFPLNLSHMNSTAEIPYGHIDRRTAGEEEPCGSWVDVSGMSRDTGRPYGLSLLNDGKNSYDVDLRDLGLTVLRSPIYAHHVPFAPDPGEEYAWIDQGLQEFRYSLLPHTGSWEGAGTARRAAELNVPPIPLVSTYHPQGTLPQSESFLSVDRENVMVTALKEAEGSGDLVLRAVEVNREAVRATICLARWGRWIEADFGPCEIKTFRIPQDPRRPVVETNLLEWTESERLEAGQGELQALDGSLDLAATALEEPSKGNPGNGHSKEFEV